MQIRSLFIFCAVIVCSVFVAITVIVSPLLSHVSVEALAVGLVVSIVFFVLLHVLPMAAALRALRILQQDAEPLISGTLQAQLIESSHPSALVAEVSVVASDIISVKDINLIDKIGWGATGGVYRASYRGTLVAVKRLHAAARPELTSKLRHELRVLSELRHPNIVRYYGIATDSTAILLVMELCGRGSLFAFLHSPVSNLSPISVQIRYSLSLDIARGLEFLHSRGIIHRDVKSLNVLIAQDGVAKLADFDSSRSLAPSALSSLGSGAGTVQWAAPEVLQHDCHSLASDVFSFGIVLWEVWTSREPFEGVPKIRIARDVMSGVRLDIPSEVPSTLSNLIQSCWETDPSMRPDMRRVLRVLEEQVEH
jgi:sterile alpha motif and leucine zipper containing kinase AZK